MGCVVRAVDVMLAALGDALRLAMLVIVLVFVAGLLVVRYFLRLMSSTTRMFAP